MPMPLLRAMMPLAVEFRFATMLMDAAQPLRRFFRHACFFSLL